MYLKNERGMSLLEVLVAVIISMFITVGGYTLLTNFTNEADVQLKDTKSILSIDAYNRLFLKDIRNATNIVYSESDGDLTLFYTTNEPKGLTYRVIKPNVYTVDYITNKVNKENLLTIRVENGERPIIYNSLEGSLTLNHSIGGVKYDYKIILRKE